jgi:hypothetical protein
MERKTGSFFLAFLICLFVFSVGSAQALQLTTTYAGGNGQSGNMFTISALQEVVINGFDQNVSSGSTGTFYIYYRSGTYQGFEGSSAGWTLAGSVAVTSAGDNVPTHIPLNLNIQIPAGQAVSFYITDSNGAGVNYTNGTAEGNVYVADANIQIHEGIGIEYPFGTTFSPRIWNGTVYYSLATNVTVPTLNQWGMIFFSCMAGLGAVYFLRRKSQSDF